MKTVTKKKVLQKAETLLRRAKQADSAGYSASAFELFNRVLELLPNRESAAYRAALNLVEIGRFSDAETFIRAIGSTPRGKQWLIQLLLGRLRMAQFRPAEAEVHFRESRVLNPATAEPAIFLASCLRRQEKFNEAAAVLVDALKTEGDLDEVYLNLALVARAQGRYEESLAYARQALEITPDYSEAQHIASDAEFILVDKRGQN
jgi:tetratricopeptide (TPR) repeat protein